MMNSRFKLAYRALVCAAIATCSIADSGDIGHVSEPHALFNPYSTYSGAHYAPLSDFQTRNPYLEPLETGPIILHVHKEVLQAYNGTIRVAFADIFGTRGEIPLSDYDIDLNAGTVTIPNPVPWVAYVVVSYLVVNDFPLVTHWSFSENNGKGGFSAGKTDGIAHVRWIPWYAFFIQGKWGWETSHSNGTIPPPPPDIPSPWNSSTTVPWDSVFNFRSDYLALFSDGPGSSKANEEVPRYEQYIGENWSYTTHGPVAAVHRSDKIREWTGFPTIHRNANLAFDPSSLPYQKPMTDTPLLQLVHNHIVYYENGDPSDGHENSLATFLLPPHWIPDPVASGENEYPTIVFGSYGTNKQVWGTPAEVVIPPIEQLYSIHGLKTVGIFWNAGGERACQSMQESIDGGANMLMDDAALLVYTDKSKVVLTGGSRGGTTALRLASNPIATYNVRSAIVANPEVRPGELFEEFGALTHKAVVALLPGLTGFANANDAYALAETGPAWQAPPGYEAGDGSTSALQLALWVLTGSEKLGSKTAGELYDDSRSNLALVNNLSLDWLILRYATHDHTKPFAHMIEFYEEVKKVVPNVLCNVLYGGGHEIPLSTEYSEVDLVYMMFNNNLLPDGSGPVNETRHYEYIDSATAGLNSQPICVTETPVVLECATSMIPDLSHVWSIVGPPGTEWQIHVKDPDASCGSQFSIAHSGTLPSGAGEFAWDSWDETLPPEGISKYIREYRLIFKRPNSANPTTWFGLDSRDTTDSLLQTAGAAMNAYQTFNVLFPVDDAVQDVSPVQDTIAVSAGDGRIEACFPYALNVLGGALFYVPGRVGGVHSISLDKTTCP